LVLIWCDGPTFGADSGATAAPLVADLVLTAALLVLIWC
jgi:hypothetical protein